MLCVRWYLRYCLTLRDLEELMLERGLSVDHSTIGRWVLRYAPELNKRVRHEIRPPNRSWRVDETFVRVAGAWTYLYRAVDSTGATIDFMLSPKRDTVAAKHFLQTGVVADRAGPSARHQCRRACVISASHCRTEGKWRIGPSLQMSSLSLLEYVMPTPGLCRGERFEPSYTVCRGR